MKELHLICNAHIDPVWQWTWDEGVSAAIATFKSACDLADEYDYIFCHNESLLYEQVERISPELFERIKALVKKGKWKIMCGYIVEKETQYAMKLSSNVKIVVQYGRLDNRQTNLAYYTTLAF